MTILITGATGTVGRQIVEQLVDKGIKVRALSRTNDVKEWPNSIEVVQGDLNSPETLEAHLQNIESIFLITQSEQTNSRIQANRKIIELAKKSNVKKIVALMDYQGNPIEMDIQESGMEWTILRPAEFMKNVLYNWAETIQQEGVIRTAFPDSLGARIHETDIAEVAVKVLIGEEHNGQIYNLTGPEALTPRVMAAQLSKGLNRPIDVIELSEEEVESHWKDQGYDEEFIKYFILEMGKNPPMEVYTVLSTVETVIGKKARTFATWITEHKNQFE